MPGTRKTRSDKGVKRGPYKPRTGKGSHTRFDDDGIPFSKSKSKKAVHTKFDDDGNRIKRKYVKKSVIKEALHTRFGYNDPKIKNINKIKWS